MLNTVLNWALLALGFGFVIFWHELGHFLAAKKVGIRVEQFAVGFGHAMLAWRKGIGLRVGTTAPEYERRLREGGDVGPNEGLATDRAAERLGLGETEYRLNWIPLGGYVKMLGQDDLNPNSLSDDPRSYNRKSVGARMFVVSAGVVMNILLAAVGFMAVFLAGLNTPPAIVGGVMPGSPAQKAGIEVGDRVLAFDGKPQHSFAKIALNTALSASGEPIRIDVQKPDGSIRTVNVTPQRMDEADSKEFRILGLSGPYELAGIDVEGIDAKALAQVQDKLLIKPGEKLVAANGVSLGVHDLAAFDRALQEAAGGDVKLTLESGVGERREVVIRARLAEPFGTTGLRVLGLSPRTVIAGVEQASSAAGKLQAGDVVYSVGIGAGDFSTRQMFPSSAAFRAAVQEAARRGLMIDVAVLREDQRLTFEGLSPNYPIAGQMVYGLGVGLSYDLEHPVAVSSQPGSPGAAVPEGMLIQQVNGSTVSNWHQIIAALRAIPAGETVILSGLAGDQPATVPLGALTDTHRSELASLRYTHDLLLREWIEPRKTNNPLVAAAWGVGETRDSIVQVYLTIRRMISGDVSVKNVSGPVGIFAHGYHFADRGPVWLLWFLSIISANLAVMNFLPIPIVDGGLFTFLLLEKLMGKPVSPRVQSAAQFVGLALLLGVFALTLYQDISRLPFMFR